MFGLKREIVLLLFCLVTIPMISQNNIEILKDSLATVNDDKKGDLLLSIANYYYPSKNDSTLLYTNKALAKYRLQNNKQGENNCLVLAGAIYGEYSMYDTAVSLLYKAVEWGEKNHHTSAQISYLQLGNIFDDLHKDQEAKLFYEKAIYGDYQPANRAAYANLGLIFLHEKKYDSASSFFMEALNEYFKSDTSSYVNKYNIGILYLNLADVDFGKLEYRNGFNKLHKALKYFSSINDYNSIAKVYLEYGNGYKMTGLTDTALTSYMKALEIVQQHKNLIVQEEVFLILYGFFESQSDFTNAYKYLKQYNTVHDSLQDLAYKSDIANLEVMYKVKEKNSRILLLEKQKRLIFLSSSLLLLGVLFISVLIIFILNNRRLKHKNERAISEAKRYISEMKTKEALNELEEIKKRLREKISFISELQDGVNKLSNKEEKKQLNEKVAVLRKTKILTDDDWEKYYKIFNEIYPEFTSKTENHKTLSEGDKRQLIFLKLGFNQKEIAYLMGISQDGVKRARQRLSKKLGLNNSGELKDYINQI